MTICHSGTVYLEIKSNWYIWEITLTFSDRKSESLLLGNKGKGEKEEEDFRIFWTLIFFLEWTTK